MRVQDLLTAVCFTSLAGGALAQDPEPEPEGDGDPTGGEESSPDPCVELPFLCQVPEPPPEPAFAVFEDELTGFTFAQWDVNTYEDTRVYYRVAIPEEATREGDSAYDAIIQILAPNTMGWVGFAWGGEMRYNPLTVAWANCSTALVSSRWAPDRSIPKPYLGATYDILRPGTFVNESHFQVTAKCTGCTAWTGLDGPKKIDPMAKSQNFGWALAKVPVYNPENNASSFGAHDATGNFLFDMSAARNDNFTGKYLVNRYPVEPAAPLPGPGESCDYAWIPPQGAVIVTTKLTETVTVNNCPATAIAERNAMPTGAMELPRRVDTVYVTVEAPATIS